MADQQTTLSKVPTFKCSKCDAIWRTEGQRDLCCTATAPEATIITIVLESPPGTNHSKLPIRTKKGVRIIKSQKARDWGDYARPQVAVQRQGAQIEYHFACLIILPDGGRSDIDAGIKQLLDACQQGGAVASDRDCRSLRVEYDEREGVLIELRDMQVAMPKTLQRSRAKTIAKRAMGG